jgi:quercetin dioxygenase-like cupin family protein
MADVGQTVFNPVTKERITFLETSASTGGERVSVRLELPAEGAVPGTHVHPEQYETFHVISGRMKFRYGLRKIVAGPGETVVVPPGVIHDFRTHADEDVVVRVDIEPALDMEELFATAVALAEEGLVDRKGMPKPVHLALFAERFKREAAPPLIPGWLVHVVLAPLRAYGRRAGHAERYGVAPKRRRRPGRPLPA